MAVWVRGNCRQPGAVLATTSASRIRSCTFLEDERSRRARSFLRLSLSLLLFALDGLLSAECKRNRRPTSLIAAVSLNQAEREARFGAGIALWQATREESGLHAERERERERGTRFRTNRWLIAFPL